jgi:hypothetical protein
MALKLLKGAWFVSMAVALSTLLYVYAGLPQEVVVQNKGGANVSISNEALFYIVMLCLAIANVLVYAIGKVFERNHDFRAWFHGLIMTLNIFFIIALIYIFQYNSNERFDYDRIAFIIYGSLALMVIWAAFWPVYLISKRLSAKSLL